MRFLLLAGLSWMTMACSVSVELDAKSCPCADGFRCDVGLDRCVPDDCTPEVSASDLHARWTTTNTILWEWLPTGDEARFLDAELWLGRSEEELASDQRIVLTKDEHLELGQFHWEHAKTDTVQLPADGLDPDQSYVAQLRTTDTGLCLSGTPLVAASTLPEPVDRIVLFENEVPAGAELQPEDYLTVVPDAEGAHLHYAVHEDPGCTSGDARPQCGQPLRINMLDRNIVRDPAQPSRPGLREIEGFLEMRVTTTSPYASDFGKVWLRFGDCSDETYQFIWEGWALRAAAEDYLLQVPLAELRTGLGASLDLMEIDPSMNGRTLCEVALSVQWYKDGEAALDDIVIRF